MKIITEGLSSAQNASTSPVLPPTRLDGHIALPMKRILFGENKNRKRSRRAAKRVGGACFSVADYGDADYSHRQEIASHSTFTPYRAAITAPLLLF